MQPLAEEQDDLVAYLRLLHDYWKLQETHAHARAAIENDLFAAQAEERLKSLEF